MSIARRIWEELTRERAWGRARPGRPKRRSRAGIALLLVLSIITLLSVIVTEVTYTASTRIRMAASSRDEAMAEALAQGGVGFYRLFLMLSRSLERNPFIANIAETAGINAGDLWQILPVISTDLLRLLVLTGGDEDDAQAIQAQGGLTAQQREDSKDEAKTSLKKAFLDFDGDFTASVIDEDSRVWVGKLEGANLAEFKSNSPHASLLYGLMATDEDQRFLRAMGIDDPWELISNLADWTDADDLRLYSGGRESILYDRLDDPYPVKNAPFDTIDEIRLVDGWHLDAVWGRYGRLMTIYGNGRINVNTASDMVLKALLRGVISPIPNDDALNRIVEQIRLFLNTPGYLGGGYFKRIADFPTYLTGNNLVPGQLDDRRLRQSIRVHSRVFRVTSRGQVGDATVEIQAVYDFTSSRRGKILSWRIQ